MGENPRRIPYSVHHRRAPSRYRVSLITETSRAPRALDGEQTGMRADARSETLADFINMN